MALIRYFKSFKDFVPTWVICVFMFFGVLIWPLVIGIILCIIQFFQRKRESNLKEKNGKFPVELKINKIKADLQAEKQKNSDLELKLEKEVLFCSTKERELEDLKIELLRKEELIQSITKDSILKEYELFSGRYTAGEDIPPGIYRMETIRGYGNVKKIIGKEEDFVSFMSDDEDTGFYNPIYNGLSLETNDVLMVDNLLCVKLVFLRDLKTDESLRPSDDKTKDSDVEINSDVESLETKCREFEEKVKSLERKIEELNGEYAYQEDGLQRIYAAEKSRLENEINIIKDEMNILNDDLINKYYIFSNYDKLASEECKNRYLMLKEKEKELRDSKADVNIKFRDDRYLKVQERSVRQILRNFNSECDNIAVNINNNNIDVARRKIQKSFETLNKLYSFDCVSLSKKILELKLEQITMIYTYELKRQQEREIQKAIKEQMIEEAKAQREIEEQKKKVEKDLQQHMGEVNRLMKYLQKAQIDAEKQMYMDKIQELEEKIKSLEADKQLVLERETNATAGFVYIISNIGSFGEDIYKIGMTRRLEPMDRIHELSSASVPFEFDVHAMIFSSNAPELENTLHKHFADKQVNKVNPRKEFFNVNIDEIEKVVKKNYNDTVQFTKIPVATEYRQSLHLAGTAS